MKCHKQPKMIPMIPMMPMMPMIPMIPSIGKNSAAWRNNHAAAIKTHTWRNPSRGYDPQRQQRRRTT